MKQSRRSNLKELQGHMVRGEWREATLMAASFARIPAFGRDRILSAREAYQRPEFQRQLGRSIEQLIEDGKAALVECYGAK